MSMLSLTGRRRPARPARRAVLENLEGRTLMAAAGLVAAYAFDEGAGSAAADASGAGNPGTISNAAWNASGKFGSALSFNGSNSVVNVADANSLDLTNGMTLEAWVRPAALTRYRTIVLKDVPGELSYGLYASGDVNLPNAWGRVNSRSTGVSGPSALPLNVWTHLAATYNGSALALFVNGAQVATKAMTGSLQTSANPMHVGGNPVWGEYFSGLIDEVRVYNRPLAPAEIQSDMNAPVGPVGPPPAPDATAPTVALTAPSGGAGVSGTVQVTASAADNVAVAGVQFKLDGANLGAEDTAAPYAVSWATAGASLGGHTLTAVARDAAGNVTTSSAVNVTVVDAAAPSVVLTAPANGSTLSGQVTLTATATDDRSVSGVQFLLDGAALGQEDTTAPYSATWDTGAAANGPHVLAARARDAAGNLSTLSSASVTVQNAVTDPAAVGQWSGVMDWPLVAMNVVLLKTGKVLMWDGGPDCIGATSSTIWDAATNTFTPVPLETLPHVKDIFCAAQTVLADGRVLVAGGHECNDATYVGVAMANLFDPVTRQWTAVPDMAYRRWYPTATTLPDGRALVTAGSDKGNTTYIPIPEVYDPRTNTWTQLTGANQTIPNYPFMFVLPDGRVIAAGSDEAKMGTYALDVEKQTWSVVDARVLDAGSAVMFLPGKIMKAGSSYLSPPTDNGGSVPSAATTYVMDATQPGASWQQTASMAYPRTHLNLTVLPDGNVLATGGSTDIGGVNTANAVYAAEMWSPVTKTWSTMASEQIARLYHSTAMLLPDGRVLVTGSGHNYYNSLASKNAEIYSPAYLFKGARPVISTSPDTAQYGSSFFVGTPDGASIASVSLIRNGSVTHSFNMDQRLVPLTFRQAAGGLTVDAPADANLAPPGTYMLFVVNADGVPSVAPFVRLPAASEDAEAPTAPANLAAAGGTGTATLNWSAAADNVKVVKYNVYRSLTAGFTPSAANRVAQVTSVNYVDSGVPSGTCYYVVTAEDAAGNVGPASNQASAVVTGDATAPTVTLTNPAGGSTVSGTIALSAAASDDVGVAGVQFLLDGAAFGAEDTTAPYSIAWNSAPVANGTHTLAARARDAAGNLTTSAVASVTVSNAAVSPNLVAAYTFDEGVGASVGDSSGRGNVGTISGGATWTAAGRYGSALVFDGASGMVTIADSNSLDLTTGMTLEAWVKPAAAVSFPTVVLKERTGGLAYSLYAADGSNRPAAAYINRSGSDFGTAGGGVLPNNAWSFLSGTYDGTTLRLYVNGALVSSRAVAGTITASNSPLHIGGNSVWREWFNGAIDEVRVYNTALSAAQIQADMNLAGAPAQTYALSGSISPSTGGAGATLSLTGAATAAVLADASGNYSFAGLADGTYTVTPSNNGFTFTPASRSVTVTGGSVTGVNFTAAAAPVSNSNIQLVQKAVNGNETGTTSMSVSLANVTAGDFLIITGTAARPSNTLTLTDSLGNTFLAAAGPIVDPAQDVTSYVWYVPSARGGADTFTITPSVRSALEIHVSEWSGMAGATVDQVSSATGNGTVISSGTRTTTADGELIFGYAWVLRNASAGTGFTPLSYVNGDLDEFQVQTTAGPAAATFTQSSAGDWLALMITFKPAPPAPTGQTLLLAQAAPAATETSAPSESTLATSLLLEDVNAGIASGL